MIRRMLFRNERKIFRVKDGITGKSILSLFPPESGYTIYEDSYWWNFDNWDALEYGQEFDPNRPFFEQLFELNKRVPKYRSATINMVNSEYSANADGLKNCYLLFNSNHTEDSAYGNGIDFSQNCYDDSHAQKCERCYGSFWITSCYDTHFSSQCNDCSSLWFSKNCRGCSNCVGCVNLRNKSYCIFNEQLTNDEYKRRIEALKLDTWSGLSELRRKAHAFWLNFPVKYLQGVQNSNVNGGLISHSKNIYRSYLIRECEDLRYVQYSQVPSSKDCMDCSLIGSHSELLYEASVCGWGGANMKFCQESWDNVHDFEYCMFCSHGSSNLFGCVGVSKRQYCILNKQYSKEDFESLRSKIIKHMDEMPYIDKQGRTYKYGDFFPPEFSPFAYNQTIASEHSSFTKEEVIAFGARWQDPNPTEYETTVLADEIPDSIKDVKDTMTNEIIKCVECGKAYRIISSELGFLKQIGIPAPRSCVDCRHTARIKQRYQARFCEQQCMCDNSIYKNTSAHPHHLNGKCTNSFITIYPPDNKEIVYCESCYNSEVV